MTDLTPEERERIYQEEKARHEARQSIEVQARRKRTEADRRRRQKTVLVLLVGSVVFVGLCSVLIKSTPSPPPRSLQKVLEDRTKAEEGVEILRQTGILIRLDAENRKAYVDNGMWKRFPEETKADTSWALAVAMGTPSVEIHDYKTGRHVGSYVRGGTYENLDLKP